MPILAMSLVYFCTRSLASSVLILSSKRWSFVTNLPFVRSVKISRSDSSSVRAFCMVLGFTFAYNGHSKLFDQLQIDWPFVIEFKLYYLHNTMVQLLGGSCQKLARFVVNSVFICGKDNFPIPIFFGLADGDII